MFIPFPVCVISIATVHIFSTDHCISIKSISVRLSAEKKKKKKKLQSSYKSLTTGFTGTYFKKKNKYKKGKDGKGNKKQTYVTCICFSCDLYNDHELTIDSFIY